MALNLGTLEYVLLLFYSLVYLLTELRPSWWAHKHHNQHQKQRNAATPTPAREKTVLDVPGPTRLPILGTRWIFSPLIGQYNLGKLHEAYKDMFNKHGPIVREEALWNFPVISLVDREDIEKVYRNQSRYPVRPPTEVSAHYRKSRPDRYTRAGLVNEQGEDWYMLRVSVTPQLKSLPTLKKLAPEMRDMADDLIRLVRKQRDPHTGLVNSFEMLSKRIGLESTCQLVLGRRMGFLEQEPDKRATELAEAVGGHFRGTRDTYYGNPMWKHIPTHGYSLYVKSEEKIYDIVSTFVDQTLGSIGETCVQETEGNVFMAVLQAPGLDIRDKKAAIVDFIASGIHTLGNTLVFVLYHLATHHTAQERLHEELLEIAPDASLLTTDAIKGAKYLKACILETYRLLPSAPCVARILEADMELSGYNLAAGTAVLCHSWLACLKEDNFKDAKCYRPERWLSEEQDSIKCTPLVMAPFGHGRRSCPGKRFAEQEVHLVCAKLIREFRISCDEPLDVLFEFLLVPEAPVNIFFRDRK